MKLEYFIAKRLHFKGEGQQRMSRPAVRIAMLSIAVGIAVMLVAVSIVVAFKQEVSNQVIGFGSHIQVSNYGSSNNYETEPIAPSDSILTILRSLPHVECVQEVATKPGIVKTDDNFHGVVLKGVNSSFDWQFFKRNLVAGDTLVYKDTALTNDVLISQAVANLLHLEVDDRFLTYFITDPVRVRRFTVRGIYQTTFADYDNLFLITDIRHVQALNLWDSTQMSQLEILVDDFSKVDDVEKAVFRSIANRYDKEGTFYQSHTIKELVPRVFEWLDMLDINARIILILMLLVAGFNMISGLLILILERTNTIGILKAMGAYNWSIRKIFLYQSLFLIGKGMFWGNIIGVSLILIQYFTHIIPLDASMYYVNYVPVSLNILYWFLINIGTVVLSLAMLILPSYLITRIMPAATIRFD
ncbi:MAG TPA: ABC transporter permease [Paludibacteraceae bacterium]|nr:ABC transporter permease [Paludibacteraceae bacterium]HRS67310.1 ABC transporter permease [Paludibacteraceae bacterium]